MLDVFPHRRIALASFSCLLLATARSDDTRISYSFFFAFFPVSRPDSSFHLMLILLLRLPCSKIQRRCQRSGRVSSWLPHVALPRGTLAMACREPEMHVARVRTRRGQEWVVHRVEVQGPPAPQGSEGSRKGSAATASSCFGWRRNARTGQALQCVVRRGWAERF